MADIKPLEKKSPSPDDFEKIKLIGKGDVGRVYLVRHKETGKLYAMKVLGKHEMLKRNKIKRALTEREILATADHPFIVTLYWCFQGNDNLYFVMKYCAGGEFFRMLMKQPNKCLPEDSARFYAAEVLLALEYLHLKGFIYRDLKPENILIHETGHIMLTDFDLSKHATTSSPQVIKKMFSSPQIFASPESTANSFVGTAEYIAPEVIEGTGYQTGAVDWWTFGILIYEMIYGTTPFKAKNQDDTFMQILQKEIEFPDHHPYHVSSSCKSIIKKLLARDVKKRLGGHQGSIEIKKHEFFKKINFVLILNEKPPLVPQMKSETDTSHFRFFPDDDECFRADFKNDPKSPFADFTPLEKTSRTTIEDNEELQKVKREEEAKRAYEEEHKSNKGHRSSVHVHHDNSDEDKSPKKEREEKDEKTKLKSSTSSAEDEADKKPKLKSSTSALNLKEHKDEKDHKHKSHRDDDEKDERHKVKSSTSSVSIKDEDEKEHKHRSHSHHKDDDDKEHKHRSHSHHKDDDDKEHKHRSHHKDEDERHKLKSSTSSVSTKDEDEKEHKYRSHSHHKDDNDKEHKHRSHHKDEDERHKLKSSTSSVSIKDEDEKEHKHKSHSHHKDEDERHKVKSSTSSVSIKDEDEKEHKHRSHNLRSSHKEDRSHHNDEDDKDHKHKSHRDDDEKKPRRHKDRDDDEREHKHKKSKSSINIREDEDKIRTLEHKSKSSENVLEGQQEAYI